MSGGASAPPVSPPSVPWAAELSEDGVARAIAPDAAARFRFDHTAGHARLWDGSRWALDGRRAFFQYVREVCRRVSEGQAQNKRQKVGSRSFAEGTAAMLAADPMIAAASSEGDFDQDDMLLACPGGVTVDLRSGRARRSDPADMITRVAGVAPDDGASPRWHQFLIEATGDDDELIRFLQVFAGYCLTGKTTAQVLAFLFGPGGNGKSVFQNILARLLGDYHVQAQMDTFAASRRDEHPTALAMLNGARLVTASETEEGRAWKEATVKDVTGGTPITARFMRKDAFTFLPKFKLLMAGNYQPQLRSVTPAMRRRVLMVPFTTTPPRADPDLEAKLIEELPQIMAWAIRGCLEWQEEGLSSPEAITAASNTYFEEQDQFQEWLDKSCELAAGKFQSSASLFASWKAFCEVNGEKPGTSKGLGSRLSRIGLTSRRKKIEGQAVRGWEGIALKNGGDGPPF